MSTGLRNVYRFRSLKVSNTESWRVKLSRFPYLCDLGVGHPLLVRLALGQPLQRLENGPAFSDIVGIEYKC